MPVKNICECGTPPGGSAVCEPHQLAVCRVVGGVAHPDCIDPPDFQGHRHLVNWALEVTMGAKRGSNQRVTIAELQDLKRGEAKTSASVVRWRLPDRIAESVSVLLAEYQATEGASTAAQPARELTAPKKKVETQTNASLASYNMNSIMNRAPLVLLISTAVSAFVMGATMLVFLDKRYIRADIQQTLVESSSGSIRFGSGTLICWGPLEVSPFPGRGDLRKINGKYADAFIQQPIVTLGIHPVFTVGAGVAWTVYEQEISPTGFSGTMIGFLPENPRNRDLSTMDLKVDYVAIGRWK